MTVPASISVFVFVSVDQVEEFLQLTTNIVPLLYSYFWLTAKALACCNLSLEIQEIFLVIFLSQTENKPIFGMLLNYYIHSSTHCQANLFHAKVRTLCVEGMIQLIICLLLSV